MGFGCYSSVVTSENADWGKPVAKSCGRAFCFYTFEKLSPNIACSRTVIVSILNQRLCVIQHVEYYKKSIQIPVKALFKVMNNVSQLSLRLFRSEQAIIYILCLQANYPTFFLFGIKLLKIKPSS